MMRGLRLLQPQDFSAELERVLLPRLTELLTCRAPGHCMRVTDLDADLMVRLCGRLRAEVPDSEVVILGKDRGDAGSSEPTPLELTVTSTKLVELRNPLPDGTQRPPLLVFLPTNLRAAAEDSFGVATFESVELGDVHGALNAQLLEELHPPLRGAVAESLRRLGVGSSGKAWVFADPSAVVRFLLTAKVNGNDAEVLGASLYELGLVPDFEWLVQPEKAPARVARNRDCVATLTWSQKSERGRVLDLGLAGRDFRRQLGAFLAEVGVEDPRAWTRRIVDDRDAWGLAFHRWEFEDGGEEPESLFVGDVETDLPVAGEEEGDERLASLAGQQVLPLGKGGARKFKVSFRVAPHPTKVAGLAKLTVQVLSKEHGPVGLVRRKSVWKAKRSEANVSFTNLGKVHWDEGWHFIRVLAQTEAGDLVPLVDESGKPLPWAADEESFQPRPNESDLFYVLPDGEMDFEPPQRAVQRAASLAHAQIRLRFTALLDERDPDGIVATSVGWADRRSVGGDVLEVKLGREGTVHVPVSRPLKVLEHKILSSPGGPISWRIPISLGSAGPPAGEASRWPEGEATERFLEARSRYFTAVRCGPSELVTQGVDLRGLRPLVAEYAESFARLVQAFLRRARSGSSEVTQQALGELRKVLVVDTVMLTIRDHCGRRREAALVAPTHPLRALWLAVWSELAEEWLRQAKAAPRALAVPTRDALLRFLVPGSFPPVLPTASGRLLTAVDNVHPFWTLYAPSNEEDPRNLVGEVCTTLGLPEPAIGGATIDGQYLASRVQRYLVQHPYVRTLVVNAFNAGRGAVLADMLLRLQKQSAFADLRYDLRLFVPDAEAPGVGAALAELLLPTGRLTAKEADVFSTPSASHLRPKLALAVRQTREFREAAASHSAHLALLFDLFPAEEVGARPASREEWAAPIHGLVQGFHLDYHEDATAVVWTRQPRHGVAKPLADAEELTDLLSTLPELLSGATAAVATGEAGLDHLRPVIQLALGSEERALLHQVHEVSDWVLTVDRNLGIEFFDHGGRVDRPDYLIDHSPDMAGGLGHRLFITSRSVAELEAMLVPVLKQYGLKAEGRHAAAILEQLRSLSGRLAMKLISSPAQQAEALGLAMSRLYLEHQGVFENQIVVPLDAHLELYRALKKSADELGDDVSFHRTDLALFDLDAGARVITCRLVEVKCYAQVGDLGAFNQLKDRCASQIAQSEEVLGGHFDPQRSAVDRPDRLVKVRELATLLDFYLERAIRYRAMSDEAAGEARFFLGTLEEPYRLDFARAAIIFDFKQPGTEPAEMESGVEFHRIGVDLIQQLIEAAAPEPTADKGEVAAGQALPSRSLEGVRHRRGRAESVPALAAAAFLGRARDRSVSWEALRARQTLGEEDVIAPPVLDMPIVEPVPSSVEPVKAEYEEPREESLQVEKVALDVAPESCAGEPEAEAATPEFPVAPGAHYEILVGVTSDSPQYGILGEVSGRKVAIDLNQTHTISLFGVQGGGKSYTLGALAEMASLPIPSINQLPQPLATVIFHYSPTMDYQPEFTSMVAPNSDEAQVAALRERYGAEPKALADVMLLVPADKLEERRTEYPGIEVHPLKFAAAELQAGHWRFLMGAVGNQATYIRQLNRVMKKLRKDLTLENLRQGIDDTRLNDQLKDLARMRLDLAAEYIDDSVRLSERIRPGRLIIVDLRDEFIEKDEALGLFVVLLQLFADARHEGRVFNKLVVFDEAHKYIESPDLVAGLIEVVREMRHKGTTIMVASQDPPSVPVSLIELSSQIILHKFNSPAWLKHIQKANSALGGLTAAKMAHLRPGEAYVWSSKATDEAFSKGAVKVSFRPRVTQHGGGTKTAVKAE